MRRRSKSPNKKKNQNTNQDHEKDSILRGDNNRADTIVTLNSPAIMEEENIYTPRRMGNQWANFESNKWEALFAVFFFLGEEEVVDALGEEFRLAVRILIALYVFSGVLASLNFSSDISATNIIQDAEPNTGPTNRVEVDENSCISGNAVAWIATPLNLLNKWIIAQYSFTVLGAADAVAVVKLAKSYPWMTPALAGTTLASMGVYAGQYLAHRFPNHKLLAGASLATVLGAFEAAIIYYGSESDLPPKILGAFITLFAVTYYNNLGSSQPILHSQELVKRVFNTSSTFLNFFRSWFPSSEVLIQSGSNIAYRGISAAGIANLVGTHVIGLEPNHPAMLPFVISAAASTAWFTGFSRVLRVHKLFFNPELIKLEKEGAITQQDRYQASTKTSKLSTLVDIAFCLLRGVSTGWLANTALTLLNADPRTSASVATFIGLGFALNNFYALKDKHDKDNLLEAYKDRQPKDVKPIGEMSPAEQYSYIEKHYEAKLSTLVNIINVASGVGREVLFLGLVIGLKKLAVQNDISAPVSLYDLMALTGFWGTATLLGDRKFYLEDIISTTNDYAARVKIFKENPTQPGRLAMALFRPKALYPAEVITKAAKAIESVKQQVRV